LDLFWVTQGTWGRVTLTCSKNTEIKTDMSVQSFGTIRFLVLGLPLGSFGEK
jgi:hypothetical protein